MFVYTLHLFWACKVIMLFGDCFVNLKYLHQIAVYSHRDGEIEHKKSFVIWVIEEIAQIFGEICINRFKGKAGKMEWKFRVMSYEQAIGLRIWLNFQPTVYNNQFSLKMF